MKRYPVFLAACTLSAHAAFSDFDAIDTDRDGRITAAEHARDAKKMFLAMDENRDGRVTAGEMRSAQRAISGLQRQRLRSADKLEADGVLTEAEHDAAVRAEFARMDADRDGFVSREEWSARHAARADK